MVIIVISSNNTSSYFTVGVYKKLWISLQTNLNDKMVETAGMSFREVAGNSTKKHVFWKEITLSTGKKHLYIIEEVCVEFYLVTLILFNLN